MGRSPLAALAAVLLVVVLSGCDGGGRAVSPHAGPGPGCAPVSDAGAPTPSPDVAPVPPGDGLDVRSVGARGDGTTDDAPAIRAALARADHVHVPAGRYLLASWATPRTTRIDADFVFVLRSHQTLTADPGAVFVLAPGAIVSSTAAWGGNVFLVDSQVDVTVSGLTLDLDGEHDLVPPGRTITGYGLYAWNSSGLRVDGVTMRDTPGQNYVVLQGGGSDVTITRTTFRNGGTSIPGNTHQDDFSAVYSTASDVRIDRVLVVHDRQPAGYSGGVELHGSGNSLTASRIEDSFPAVYVGPDTALDLPVMRDTTVACNVFDRVARGVVFNALGTGDVDGVQVSDNLVRLAPFAAFPDEPTRAVDQDRPPGEAWTYHHVISGLQITDNRVEDLAATTDAAVRLSQVHGAVVSGNSLLDLHGAALVLSNSPWGLTDVSFRENRVTWSGGAAAPLVSITVDDYSESRQGDGEVSGITIADNRVEQTGPGGTGTCGVFADWAAGARVSGVSVRGNELEGVDPLVCGPQAASVAVDG